jgi:hypothetical protein
MIVSKGPKLMAFLQKGSLDMLAGSTMWDPVMILRA